LKIHIIIAHGDMAEKTSRIAQKEKMDLIVIASHGTKGRKKSYLGSVTEKLIRISSVPTLIIPNLTEKEK
jgi:nucleotide-binding universal stress UspA family protein